MNNKMDKNEYSRLADRKTPASKTLRNCARAFLCGGIICTIGQALFCLYTKCGFDEEGASALVSISLIFLSALLTGIGVYDSIAKFAGAGTIVPITGFANAVVSPAIEAKTEGFVLGVGTKLFTIAGPVIVYGAVSSVIAGLVYWIGSMI